MIHTVLPNLMEATCVSCSQYKIIINKSKNEINSNSVYENHYTRYNTIVIEQ